MELKTFFAQGLNGPVIPGAVITVYAAGTTTLSTGLQHAEGSALSNPFNADGQGKVVLAAPDGDYDIKVAGAGRTTTIRVRFIDAAALAPAIASIGANLAASEAAADAADISRDEAVIAKDLAVAAAASASGAVSSVLADLASPNSGNGASLVVLEDERSVQAAAKDAWGSIKVPASQWAAIRNGTSTYDATAVLQATLDAGGDIHWPGGLWNVGPLFVSTTIPTTITLGAGCKIKARAGYGTNDCLLTIGSGADVTIFAGSGAELRMRKADYTTGEWRHCVNTFGAKKAHIYGLLTADSGGDGFYVGGASEDPALNTLLFECSGDNHRRQGFSIVNAVKCRVLGGLYENTVGTAPAYGGDIESNLLPGYYLSDILVQGVRFRNNFGGGILITPQSMANPVNITVRDCVSEGDGSGGGLALNAPMAYRTVAPATDPANIGKIAGRVYVDNMTIINPQGRGVATTNWNENAPDTHIGTVTVINPCSNPTYDTNDIHRCAWLIRSEVPSGGQYGTSVGNLRFDNLIAIDNRTTKKMAAPLYCNIADEANKPLKNLHIENIDAVKADWTSVVPIPVLFAATKATDSRINYRKPRLILAASGTTVTPAYAGCTLYASGAASYTLALAANCIGMEVEFLVIGGGAISVIPNAADVIDIYSGGVAGNAAASSTTGYRLKLRAAEAGRWEVVNAVGSWA